VAAPEPPRSLAGLLPGSAGLVLAVELEDDLTRWLAAIGIACGDRVEVLRRAPFGGPIHLRTHAGGEFAVDRSLALQIHIAPVTMGETPRPPAQPVTMGETPRPPEEPKGPA